MHRHLKGVNIVRRGRLPADRLKPRLLPDGTGYFAGYAHVALTVEYAPLCPLLLWADCRNLFGSELFHKVVIYHLGDSLVLAHIAALRHQGAGVPTPEVFVCGVIQVGVFDAPKYVIAAKICG